MKLTRYPQSCLLIEYKDTRIVIDPGDDYVSAGYGKETLGKLDAVLYTHQHGDHYDSNLCEQLILEDVAVYANASTAELIGSDKCNVVQNDQTFNIGPLQIRAIDLPHCLLPDGTGGPQNTGYVVEGTLFHPGDGKELEGLKVNNIALPINGPDISMLDAFNFAKQVRAKIAIPIHYDKLGGNPRVYAEFAERLNMSFEMIVLENGESTELS